MTAPVLDGQNRQLVSSDTIQTRIQRAIDETLAALPKPSMLTGEQRRGIIARYAAVLEGNFIYWMTGTYLSVRRPESKPTILENLREEIRDCHPGMMRRFAIAAQAAPTESDFMAVYQGLMNVRLFVARMATVRLLVMMAFFEGFIQRFMSFLEEIAVLQGSTEKEYTQVHGVCDIRHAEGLICALMLEMEGEPALGDQDQFEGVELLRTLIRTILDSGQSVYFLPAPVF
jgi:Iron-containing redox enzyme